MVCVRQKEKKKEKSDERFLSVRNLDSNRFNGVPGHPTNVEAHHNRACKQRLRGSQDGSAICGGVGNSSFGAIREMSQECPSCVPCFLLEVPIRRGRKQDFHCSLSVYVRKACNPDTVLTYHFFERADGRKILSRALQDRAGVRIRRAAAKLCCNTKAKIPLFFLF